MAKQRTATGKVTIELVTVAKATEWLGRNKNFRRLDDRYVSKLARAIAMGRWEVNGESIKFDADGNLIDGQHRLRAVIVSGKSIRSAIMRGASSDTYVDIGSRRLAGQYLASKGFQGNSTLAAAARLLYIHIGPGLTAINSRTAATSPDHGELEMVLHEHPGLVESVRAASVVKDVGPGSLFGFVHYIAAKTDRDAADLFLYAVGTGDGIGRSDSAYWLRKRFMDARMKRVRIPQVDALFLAIKCWNSWMLGKKMQHLRISPGEDFPEFAKKPRKKAPA